MLDRTAIYCKYYASQAGGELPVFRGGQHGAGLGDVFRGILRFIAPIALRGISTFANSTMQAREQGATFKDAALGALRPTLGAMGQSFRQQAAANSASQGGSGLRRVMARQSGCGVVRSSLFSGERGVPFGRSDVYKSQGLPGNKRKRTSKKKHSTKHRKSLKSEDTALNF